MASEMVNAVLSAEKDGAREAAEAVEKIFERTYTVSDARTPGGTAGSGLGLAIVKHIVEIHDARIELDSAPGVGTTVTVMF